MAKNLISIEEATQEEKKRKDLDERLTKQENLSLQIIIGVVVAFLFTIGLVGIEIMLFHTRTDKEFLDFQNQYFQEIKELREKQFESEIRKQQEINLLKLLPLQTQEKK